MIENIDAHKAIMASHLRSTNQLLMAGVKTRCDICKNVVDFVDYNNHLRSRTP